MGELRKNFITKQLKLKKMKNLLLTAIATVGFALISNGQTVPNNVPTNGLIGWYPFDGNANDESTNGNNGIINGATLTADRFGDNEKAYEFNGPDTFITLPNDFFNGTQNGLYSINLWAKHNSTNKNSVLFYKGGSWKESSINLLSNGKIHYGYKESNTNSTIQILESNTVLDSNKWYNICITAANGEVKLYINGILESQLQTNYVVDWSTSINTSCAGVGTHFGKNYNNCSTNNGNYGIIDDFGIWNRSLTQEEISDLYNGNETVCVPEYIPTNGLIGFWPFCGNANDESGNNLDGTIIGSTELTNDRFDQTNSAYDFDYANASFGQQNDEIYIPYDDILNVNNITASVWVYPRQYFWSGDSGTANTVVLTRWENGTSNPSGTAWRIVYDSSSVLGAISNGTSSRVAEDNNPLTLNNWNHIVMTYNSESIKLYINGVLKATTTSPGVMNTASTSGISIGEAAQYNGYWHPTDGIIDDIGIWDRALTAQEITNLYNGTSLTTTELYENDLFEMYPNPVKNYLNLKTKSNLIGSKYIFYNSLGAIVLSGKIKSELNLIDMNYLSEGLYFLKIENNYHITYKIIKN